jgi:hypothetical protein
MDERGVGGSLSNDRGRSQLLHVGRAGRAPGKKGESLSVVRFAAALLCATRMTSIIVMA